MEIKLSLEESVKAVSGISFAVFSPSEVRKYSVVEITAPETYDEDGMTVQGGLMDNRLGTLEPGQKCGTCGNTSTRCPGHFGHVELAESVLHIAFVNNIHKLLISTCRACGRLRLTDEELDSYRSKINEQKSFAPTLTVEISKEIILKAKKIKECPHCEKVQFDIDFTKPTIFHEITEDGGATRLLPIAIRERMERLQDEDLKLLLYDPTSTRPEWFVLQVLAVPPVAVRPSITLESGIRSEDDLTHKVVDILRVNQRVKESKDSGTPPLIVQDLVDLLQYHVTTFFDNEVSGIPQAHHRSGRPLKTLSQRLKGKEGRFRGSLSGKRVDFSGRTVISPDPSIDISEVGVPFDIAKKLTISEKVSSWNIDMLKKAIIKGPSEHPGANYIIRQDGVKIRLDYVTDRTIIADSLSPGFIVERHLRDGDIAIFNRQPSLHRMSVMSHFVRVLPNRTFRLHPAVCPPYNADFDGDEMNIHIPQSEEARSEAMTLMKVQDQILSPRYGGPIIGAIRDFITAAYLLTKNDTLLPKDVFTDLALAAGYSGPLPKPEVKTPKPLYKGLQLFSLILPNDFNYVMSSKWSQGGKSTTEQDVVIKNGELKKGIIDRAAIGAEEPDSILHRISKDYGTDRSREFLNSTLSMLRAFITRYGFSYGFDELELTPKAQNNVNLEMDNAYQRVANHIDLYEKGTLPLTRGLSAEEVLEFSIMNELATARDKAGRIADKNFDMKNAGMIMARTGARGSSLNVGQMTAALGQQSVRGERIKKGYQNRALTHFKRDDNSPDSRGFVKSNYRIGLNPTEFFFHAMGGREGLVDTAVRTQQSGYMQRRLINALEHIKVEYDLTVRDPDGNLIQFLYGEDGIDPAKSDHGKAVNVKRLADTEAILEDITKEKIDVESILKKYKNEFNPKMLQTLRDTFKSTTLSKKTVSKIVKKTSDLLVKATVEPGEASGIVAAQSIGEPGTQMTLRTFHFAGVKEQDVTLGLPRLIELVDARKQPATPSMTVYLDKVHRVSKDKTLEVGKEILFTKVADLVDKTVIEYEQGIRIILSAKKLAERKTDVEQVGAVLKTGKRKVEVVDNNTVIVTLEDADLATLFALKNKLMKVRVKGIPGVTRITVTKRNNEWFIQTTGSNLAKVLKINGVDLTKTTTNNITEIAITLGIEAARQAMVNEITSTLEEQGLEVDIRHILLVADLMTSKGSIQSIGRHGIAGKKTSVLARAAFEITVPTIATAAISGEVERLKGVTENVIVGLPIPLGTGMIDIFMKG